MQPSSRQSPFFHDDNGAQNRRLPGGDPIDVARGNLQGPQPQPNDTVVTQPVTAALPQMVFPGPYAYAQHPVAVETDNVSTDSNALPIAGSDTTGTAATSGSTTTSTTASSTTSSSTAAASDEPDLPDPDDNPDGLPPFILAAARGKLGLLNEILSASTIDVDMADEKYGSSALMFAAQEGHLDVVARLLNAGSDLNWRNQAGLTPLAVAACSGYTEVLALLLKAPDIDLNLADINGRTPLSHAAESDHADIVKQLIAADAKVDVADMNGNTALMKAAHRGFVRPVQALLQHPRIRIDQRGEHGATALLFAASLGHVGVVQALLHAGADTGMLTTHGENAFDLAVLFQQTAAIEIFTEHGMPLDALSKVEDSMENVPFIVTATDLLLWTTMPPDSASNPLGFCDPALLDRPLVFLSKLIAKFEERVALEPASAFGS